MSYCNPGQLKELPALTIKDSHEEIFDKLRQVKNIDMNKITFLLVIINKIVEL